MTFNTSVNVRSSLATALLMSSSLAMSPPTPPTPAYEAHLTGALSLELRGATAEFGTAPGEPGPFVVTLGATSEEGALVFTRWDGSRPGAGTYQITDEPAAEGIQVLVVTGSPTRPTGVFRARHGSLTITSSGLRGLSARFQMDAVGFLASQPEREDRELSVRGSFAASPSR
jgi:hypothetical protein